MTTYEKINALLSWVELTNLNTEIFISALSEMKFDPSQGELLCLEKASRDWDIKFEGISVQDYKNLKRSEPRVSETYDNGEQHIIYFVDDLKYKVIYYPTEYGIDVDVFKRIHGQEWIHIGELYDDEFLPTVKDYLLD